MSHYAFPHVPLRLFRHCLPQISRLAIAAVLFGFAAALAPAQATEDDIRENDSGLFNVPGEGSPYVDRLHPRVNWPPLPDRRPGGYLHHAEEDAPGYLQGAPYAEHKRVFREEPYEDHGAGRDYAGGDKRDYAGSPHGYDGDRGRDYERVSDEDAAGESYQGRGFGRIFPDLGDGSGAASYKALQRLGRSMIEEGDPNDPAGNSEIPSGYTYLGQFIDHDLTLDTTTDLGHQIRSDAELENARTPDLDLDNVYGGGPGRMPHLYRVPYLRVGHLISEEGAPPRFDLFRTKASHYEGPAGGDPVALLGDPRDDENIIVSQIHAAFVAFHNRTVDILVERGYGDRRERFCHHGDCNTQELADALPDDAKAEIFETAKNHVIHYYHRLIIEDFLPRIIGPQHTASLLHKHRNFFFPHGFRDESGQFKEAFIPVEFAAAAYRFGHSMVRESYTLREGVRVQLLTDGRGGAPRAFTPVIPRWLIDWRYFFDIGPERPFDFNYARRIDPELTPALHRLHFAKVVGMQDVTSLAARNLARGKTLRLPSGQEVARVVLPELEARGLLGGRYGHGEHGGLWQSYLLPPDDRVAHFLGDTETPLWYYVLQEASIFGTPTHLYARPGGEDGYVGAGGDFPHYGRERYFRRVSGERHYGPPARGRYGDGPDGGNRLGPVGATIVGEVLTGLVEHYREKTGEGLDYEPKIKGSVSAFGGGAEGKYGSGGRYMMRNFLIDAGVVEDY
ncbi:MAG TPA: peroxidase family protein [Hyphomicrobiales bacterium]